MQDGIGGFFMIYQSTRNAALTATATQAVLRGLAPDGGLYVPDRFEPFPWREMLTRDTFGMAEGILSALLPEFEDMHGLVQRAYRGKFETDELTPLVPVGGRYVLELFRGPTSAFKDVALSMLPQLITAARRQEGVRDEIVILTATSGDTGKAALAGFQDVPGTRILVFYPDAGVSAVQKAQMVTQEGANVCVCAVRGNFDDTQTGVKQIFAAGAPENSGVRLSSANSINIGRLAPQVVYYFKAYADLLRAGRVACGEPADFVVPTGNFGDILAGYFAKRMGLPVGRLLYLLCGDCEEVAGYMRALRDDGCYTVSPALLGKLRAEFACGCCSDEETKQTIGRVWREEGYLMDTHTAVAWHVAGQYQSDAPVVVLSTASAYKFPAAVLSAVGGDASGDEFDVMERLHALTGVPVPKALAELRAKPVRHHAVIDREEMPAFVNAHLKG